MMTISSSLFVVVVVSIIIMMMDNDYIHYFSHSPLSISSGIIKVSMNNAIVHDFIFS